MQNVCNACGYWLTVCLCQSHPKMATLMNEVLKAKKMRTTTTFFFSQVRVYGHGFDLLHYLFLCLFVGLFVSLLVC